MTAGPIVVVGDVLLDREVVGTVDRLCPEAPVPVLSERSTHERPGGAGLAALFCASSGAEVVVISGFSADAGGRRLRELLQRAGIRVIAVPLHGPTAEKVRFRSGQHLLLRLDRGDLPDDAGRSGGAQLGRVPPSALATLRSARAILVSDYGRGVAAHPEVAVPLREEAGRVPVVWDPHPKGPAPVPGARLVTPTRGEAAGFVGALNQGRPPERSGNGHHHNNGHHETGSLDSDDPHVVAAAADAMRLRRSWAVDAVSVTLGDRGAVLCAGDGSPMRVAVPFAAHGDACGAGDRFASAAVTAVAAGAHTTAAVRAAVEAASGYVAAGGALALDEPIQTPLRSHS